MLNTTSKYLRKIGLTINPAKTNYITNTKENTYEELNLDGQTIKETKESVRYLGLYINGKLNWNKSIKNTMASYQRKLTKIKYRKIPGEIKKMLIEIACNKGLEYTTQFTLLNEGDITKARRRAGEVVKYTIPLRSTATTTVVYADIEHGGIGLRDPASEAEEAFVATTLRTLNSPTRTEARDILRQRAKDDQYSESRKCRDFNQKVDGGKPIRDKANVADYMITKLAILSEKHNLNITNKVNDTTEIMDTMDEADRGFWEKLKENNNIGKWNTIITESKETRPMRDINRYRNNPIRDRTYKKMSNLIDKARSKAEINTKLKITANPHPYKPNPADEEFNIKGLFRTQFAFTDGSYNEGRAGWGAFFKKGSKYNKGERSSNAQSNNAAELEAIE